MIKTFETKKYEAKSLKDGFKNLSIDEQAKALSDDASVFGFDFFDPSILSDEDKKKYDETTKSLNELKNISDNISARIQILKKYPQIKDYQIIAPIIGMSADLGISREDFIKQFLLEPYSNGGNVPLLEAPKSKEHTKQSSENGKQTAAVAKDMSTTITANDIVANCNAHTKDYNTKPEYNQQQMQPNSVVPIHPELDINAKANIIKQHITFVPNVEVKAHEVDALLSLVEGAMLKSKLKELNAKCNPDFPVLVQTAKYNFDHSAYNFAFYVESNTPGKSIVILYNTNPKTYPNGLVGNDSGYALVNTEEVK